MTCFGARAQSAVAHFDLSSGDFEDMYLIAIAWLYVVMIVAVADTTLVGSVLTFIFWGLAPLALFLWLFGTPQRRRQRTRKEAEASQESVPTPPAPPQE